MQGLRMEKNRSILDVCEDFSTERNAADYRLYGLFLEHKCCTNIEVKWPHLKFLIIATISSIGKIATTLH